MKFKLASRRQSSTGTYGDRVELSPPIPDSLAEDAAQQLVTAGLASEAHVIGNDYGSEAKWQKMGLEPTTSFGVTYPQESDPQQAYAQVRAVIGSLVINSRA